MMSGKSDLNLVLKQVYDDTKVLRRPVSGFVAGYHRLPYVLVAPGPQDRGTVEISGAINVSPKILITPQHLRETFGDIFDPDTFDGEISGRVFSFAVSRRQDMKVASEHLSIKNLEENPEEYSERLLDRMMQAEDTTTGLVFAPKSQYYPVAIDRFINEILDREFRF